MLQKQLFKERILTDYIQENENEYVEYRVVKDTQVEQLDLEKHYEYFENTKYLVESISIRDGRIFARYWLKELIVN